MSALVKLPQSALAERFTLPLCSIDFNDSQMRGEQRKTRAQGAEKGGKIKTNTVEERKNRHGKNQSDI